MTCIKRLFVLCCGLFAFLPQVVLADNQANFTVRAEPSAYQVDKDKTYFDLSLPAETPVDLVVHVTNNADQAITVKGEVAPATTNVNGVVEYGVTTNKLTADVPFDLKQVAKFEQETQVIDAKQTVDFILHLTTPTQDYAGLVAGGLTFTDVTESDSSQEKSLFENRFAYAIALLLHGNQADTPTEVALTKVTATQLSGRNILSSSIVNQSANYINQVTLKAKVLNAKKKVILKDEKTNLQIAPNSIFQYPLYYNGQKMKAGRYTIKITLTSKEKTWHLEQTVKISQKKAQTLNRTDVTPKEEKASNWLIWLLVGIVAILLLIIAYLIWKQRRR